MKEFEQFLVKNNYSDSTITQYCLNMELLTRWAEKSKIKELCFLSNKNILEYVKNRQQSGLNVNTINNEIRTFRLFFECQKSLNKIAKNPIQSLQIKGELKTVVSHPFTREQLVDLFIDYCGYIDQLTIYETGNVSQQIDCRKRKKAMLSLMIFQGLHRGELSKLVVEDITLKKGTIYIPSVTNSNSRVLQLESIQILVLNDYLESIKANDNILEDRLFACSVVKTLTTINQELKGLNQNYNKASQIRASVIMNWIQAEGLRKAQYKSGHKKISSTQQYEKQDIRELSEKLQSFHLFG